LFLIDLTKLAILSSNDLPFIAEKSLQDQEFGALIFGIPL